MLGVMQRVGMRGDAWPCVGNYFKWGFSRKIRLKFLSAALFG